ncbi:conserved domain protein [Verrucomicrobiia bacterium DG1235]|nr:conserved domain protein [Verrucomicrobiae bacterium DG1235]
MYHVINRGNYRERVFQDDGAKKSFEKALFESCEEHRWILHAYCLMGNHFHLALETPEGNLSKGMGWLQSTYAMRFNRYRKENGHIFQGRFKSIVVEGAQRLAWLCHYIHLNPVRANILSANSIGSYRYSSLHWLVQGKKGRPPFLEFSTMLDTCGGLRDGPVGRKKYMEYLAWLSVDEPRQKSLYFDRMSKGWAHGSEEFKDSLLEDKKVETAQRIIDGDAGKEAKEQLWKKALASCLEALKKGEEEIDSDPKSADWKVAVCAFLRQRFHCQSRWISERINMGTEAGVSRGLRRLRENKGAEAERILETLKSSFKS